MYIYIYIYMAQNMLADDRILSPPGHVHEYFDGDVKLHVCIQCPGRKKNRER